MLDDRTRIRVLFRVGVLLKFEEYALKTDVFGEEDRIISQKLVESKLL